MDIPNLNSLNLNSKLKVLTIGDPHFKTKNKKETDLFAEKSLEYINSCNPNFVVILGDILDTHEKIHVVPLTQAIEWIEKIAVKFKTFLLIGNHDRPNNSDFLSSYHPFNGLKDNHNIIVVDDVYDVTMDDYKFLFVPYVPPGRFIKALSTKIDVDTINEYTAIFAHQEFFGAKMGAIISKEGDKWPLTYPLVISGHIHDYNRPQDNIIYTGTPLQHAFGDSSHKTISIYLFNSNETIEHYDSKNIINDNVIEYRVDLNLPKKRIFRLTPNEVITWRPPENALIKVIIKGTNAEIKATSKMNQIKEWSKAGIKIDYKTLDDHEGIAAVSENNDIQYKKFTEILKDKIANDPDMVYWYEKLFSFSP